MCGPRGSLAEIAPGHWAALCAAAAFDHVYAIRDSAARGFTGFLLRVADGPWEVEFAGA